MATLPKQLQFNQLQSKSFYSFYKQWPIQPIANSGQYWPGQVIRIFLNGLMDGGVMDPYHSHLEITVQCDSSTLPVGLLQIDGSAQSFISQFVLSSKNRQVERIIQYGALAGYLTDCGLAQMYAQGRQTQGLGYSNIDNYQNLYNNTIGGSTSMVPDPKTNVLRTINIPGTIFPTIPTKHALFNSYGSQAYCVSMGSGLNRAHINWLNCAWYNQQQQIWWWYIATSGNGTGQSCKDFPRTTNLTYYGYLNNLRAQYLSSSLANNYVDGNSSLSKYQIRLNKNVQNQTFPAKFTNNTVYQTYIPTQVPVFFADQTDSQTMSSYTMANQAGLTGYTNLCSPQFSKGVRQPFISPTVPQCQMAGGVILPQKIPISQRTFKIPLISAIIGLLIPQNQYIMIPLKAVDGSLIQITIDPYAMFTSGYNDISQFDNVGMGLMQQRAFKITRIVYNLHTYQFFDPQMDQYLKVSLTSGIAINTHFWQLGNQYQIQNSQSLTNSWPVACNQEALNQILVLFYPLDFQNFSFCRKHFRISNNITKLQLRINMQYYPSQPLSGNGGNPIQIDSTGNNSVFLQQIMLSNGYFFSNLSASPRINAYNFAINDRCYNIYNTHTFYDPAMIDNVSYQWNAQSINNDTALGMANLHQNRYLGKAAYLFSFDPYAHSKQLLTGIDCRSAKQFDVIFTSSPDNFFPRPQMMLIYTRSSNIVQYGKQGIINIGK